MSVEPEVRVAGEQVVVRKGRVKLTSASLSGLLEAIDQSHGGDGVFQFRVQPPGVRMLVERRDAVAMAVEIPPHSRRVRWLAAGSKKPFGMGASYEEFYLSFPYVVVLLVFRAGSLTGQQQLYYRTEPLDRGDELLLPNLYNVARGYGQQCWVCLQHVQELSDVEWGEKIRAIVDHVFSAAFNRSAEEHEGNSYWSSQAAVDPRVASIEAWQEATRANRRMALDVPWKSAETTASAELKAMLGRVVRPRSVRNATDLAGLVAAVGSGQEKGSITG